MNSGRPLPVQPGGMFRKALVATLTVLALATPSWAGGEKFSVSSVSRLSFTASTPIPASLPFVVATRPFVVVPNGSSVANPGPAFVPVVPDPRSRPFVTTIVTAPPPQVVVVQQTVYYPVATAYAAPSTCQTQGAWSYRWIPYTTTQNVWVPGLWDADGAWVDSHWEARPYSSGYYEPYWVSGQTYAC